MKANAVVLALLVGCGSSNPPSDSGAMDTGVAPADRGPVIDVSSDTAGADGSADVVTADVSADAGSPLTHNPLLLSSGVFGGSGNTNLLYAGFAAEPGQRCAVAHTGACWVLDCRARGDGGASPVGVSAGHLELFANGAQVLVADPSTDGTYDAVTQTGAYWLAGDTLSFRAQGATVPAFDVSLTAPPTVTVLSPVGSGSANTVTIDRARDLVVTWQPINGGVTVAMNQYPSGTADLRTGFRFYCEFPGSAGTGTVPASVVGLLQTTADLHASTPLAIGGNATIDITPGGYAVHVHAMNNASLMTAAVQ